MDWFEGRGGQVYHESDRRSLLSGIYRYSSTNGQPTNIYAATWPEGSRTDQQAFKPIRINASYTMFDSASHKAFLEKRLLPATIDFFSNALR